MGKLLWRPSDRHFKEANITRFIEFVNENYGLNIDPYAVNAYFQLYDWSINNLQSFWDAVWRFTGIKTSQMYSELVDDLDKFPGARWFIGARLNFAENLLRYRDDHTAFIFKSENGGSRKVTYAELYNAVSALANSLRELGISPGDRLCGYMPNIVETSIAMLAAASLGAIWASCGTELGAGAVVDRIGQIEPKILFTVDGYWYKGGSYNILGNVEKIVKAIPSIKKVVIFPYIQERLDISAIPNSIYYEDFVSTNKGEISFEQVPSDHPIYIMFSSGTTGKPKCMVQSCSGVLVNHLKELIIHTDLKREDRILYITSPSWMMWNWLMSSLAVGATIILYDGNPNYPDWGTMWRIIQEERVTIFGCSASYIYHLKSVSAKPGETYDLSSLREISQTGSALSAEGFEWVYKEVKEDLHFNSISGGTDINGCFAIGTPTLPVHAGELQAPGLGMKIKSYDERGEPIWDREGELVCEAPAPSMPIYFWNDPNNEKYLDTYFRFYTHKRVWRHGDYVIFHSDTGGITFLGRSDAVLKPSGVRIGTAEIYNIVERLPEVADSLAVGQNWRGDQRIILFVKLKQGYSLTEELKNKIKKALRENASPRHVPAKIIETPDIPYTFNMKKVEIAVSNIINGKPVLNRDALMNPESLTYFEKILPELQRDD
ncbi:MAG: acetoacetate--CoA ligase [Candidatus Bathyarchaeota archaeon]|nr:acetoacetate--CoA ligase [Candidatus Bathyarchaeota archaeon]